MKKDSLSFDLVQVINPDSKNLIFGQANFIKTVEDVHEALITAVPNIKFGLAFCEASGPRLIRTSGTDEAMIKLATTNAKSVGCGHTFFLFLENAYPINVLNTVLSVPEVVNIYAATSNPLQVVVAQTQQGKGVAGVIDGESPLGVENAKEKKNRHAFLRKIGYKQ
jgi:adenosine/AMP kinase